VISPVEFFRITFSVRHATWKGGSDTMTYNAEKERQVADAINQVEWILGSLRNMH
jgi:hypothetical protein